MLDSGGEAARRPLSIVTARSKHQGLCGLTNPKIQMLALEISQRPRTVIRCPNTLQTYRAGMPDAGGSWGLSQPPSAPVSLTAHMPVLQPPIFLLSGFSITQNVLHFFEMCCHIKKYAFLLAVDKHQTHPIHFLSLFLINVLHLTAWP